MKLLCPERNKKIQCCSIFFIILFFSQVYGIGTFEKTYGGDNNDYGYSVQSTSDGGYIIAGYTNSFGFGNADVYLIKTNSLGDTLWTKTYGGTQNDYGYSAQQTNNSGYIIGGSTNSFGAGGADFYLIKTDSSGDTLWTKTYGGVNQDYGRSMQQTKDSGYIITGYTNSFGTGGADVYLIKTNSSGDTLWTRTYGGSGSDYGHSVQETKDSGYIITGYTNSFGAGLLDVYLVKTNSSGDILWIKTYGGSQNDGGYFVQQTQDDGYIITGYTNSFGAGVADFYLLKTNSSGDSLWAKTYGGANQDYGESVQQTSDKGYIITGWTYSFSAGTPDVYLVKTDSSGDTLWTRIYDKNNHGAGGEFVQETQNGGYIITGFQNDITDSSDVYLIKTDSVGKVGIEEQSNLDFGMRSAELEAYPNPFVGNTVISYSGISYSGEKSTNNDYTNTCLPSRQALLTIYDISGKLVKSFPITKLPNDQMTSLKWDGRDNNGKTAKAGVYFVKLNTDKNDTPIKLIKVR
ncbi:MAG: T9SS type A sorting domain-containing protein [bacterium]